MDDRQAISAVERHSLGAWPALESEVVGGWALRAALGYSKRANSASSFDAHTPPWAAATRFYETRGLPLLFRLTPLSRGVAEELEARRFTSFESSLVLTRPPLSGALPARLHLAERPDEGWLEAFAAAHGTGPERRALHGRILAAITAPVVFATLHAEGRPVAFGMAVAGAGLVGLFDIVTRPEARRFGHARRLVEGLLAWGGRQGAGLAYLQMIAANQPARALYDRLGFKPLYAYDYWKSAEAEGS